MDMLSPDKHLRNYQKDMLGQILKAWTVHKNVMVQMPTGTGKTHLLSSLVNKELRTRNNKPCVWIVAHRRELVEQIEKTVARYGIPQKDERVKVMSIQWLSRHWNDMRDERPSLIVIDEAHHALAETYKELWLHYPNAKKLGMTATPCRMNYKGFTDLFDTLITSDSIADFIRQGWLSVFDYVSIRPDSEDQLLVDSLLKRGADGDFQMREMNEVLNHRPSIERLHESIRQYAYGKKGIVYAISINHARNIAAHYINKGIKAAAIDSKTPAGERQRLVEEFRQGRIQVLVNVDVFSEGFDCPDVEFIQLARPTLSLAKYLQQVGRGLRMTENKKSCAIIDNVGLYRLFGLPTAYRDWQAMFEGRLSGKGYPAANERQASYMAAERTKDETPDTDGLLETIMSHEQLLDYLQNGFPLSKQDSLQTGKLKPFKDRQSGLWGLKQGQTITATAQYLTVFDVKDQLAAVRFKDYRAGIVEGNGNIRMKFDRYHRMKFLPDSIALAEDSANHTFYIDLKSETLYNEKPKALMFGTIEMLKVGNQYCSRTKHVYKSHSKMNDFDIIQRGFYLRIYDGFPCKHEFKQIGDTRSLLYSDCVCILENDTDDYYWICGELADGSIVIADEKGNYYHASESNGKQYITSEHPQRQEEDFDTVVSRLQAKAETHAERIRESDKQEKEEKRQEQLAHIQNAVPFQSGLKWGLKSGNRIIVPPIYRNIQKPVGNYCAVEANPQQWGIIMLDGKMVIEARYSQVEINDNGIAQLTIIPGKTKIVKLKACFQNAGSECYL